MAGVENSPDDNTPGWATVLVPPTLVKALDRYIAEEALDFGMASPLNGKVPGYNLRGGLVFASPDQRSPFDTDRNNVQPRVGFAWQLDDRTVVRGGSGLYFAVPLSVETFWMAQAARLAVIQYSNNGRPDFAANPTNGQPLPTLEEAQQRFCHVNNAPGCLFRSIQELIGPEQYTTDLARTWREHGIGRVDLVENRFVGMKSRGVY